VPNTFQVNICDYSTSYLEYKIMRAYFSSEGRFFFCRRFHWSRFNRRSSQALWVFRMIQITRALVLHDEVWYCTFISVKVSQYVFSLSIFGTKFGVRYVLLRATCPAHFILFVKKILKMLYEKYEVWRCSYVFLLRPVTVPVPLSGQATALSGRTTGDVFLGLRKF
jgi:hypothetical protein